MLTKSIIDCHKSLSTPIIITFPLSFLPAIMNLSCLVPPRTYTSTLLSKLHFFPSLFPLSLHSLPWPLYLAEDDANPRVFA